ncbi:unnamed protein product [Closterium sp. NIES-64]|nr:unnamed protein product [Closterium sp. NIES-64]
MGEQELMGKQAWAAAEARTHAGVESSAEAFVAVDSCGADKGDLFTPLLVARDQLQEENHTHEENRMSLTGVACASIASILATLLAFAATLPVSSDLLKLRLALLACALWWLLLSLFTFLWLRPRPGPPFPPPPPLPSSSHSSACHRTASHLTARLASALSSAFAGWRHMGRLFAEARRYRSAFAFLLCYFVYADGYTTILQIGVLFGRGTSRWMQPVLTNKAMVMLMLAGMLPLPLWGLLGYLTPPQSIGLKAPWELFVFACWFGFFLGGLNAYSKTLFIDMIPVGRARRRFSLSTL